ncbi:MAG: FMN-binding protein [Bacilli bacterium]
MAKPLPSFITVGLTAITAFSILFVTQFLTQPILENRENQVYLDLLDLNSFSGYTLGEFETATGELLEAGIQRYRTYRMENQIVAMTYEVNTNGYASGLQFQIGIREGIIRQLLVMQHNETTGYGADALLEFPDAMNGLPLNDTNAWTAELVSVSTGATFTRRGIVLSLTAIQADYASRIGT